MKGLTVINRNGQFVVDSREVAEMVDKRHDNLVRDIDGYVSILNQTSNLRTDHFFIESSYQAGTGKKYKSYLITRKGCDMVANKMTGEKGILFTATYVAKFEEMETQLKLSMQELSPQLQILINMELNQKRLENQLLMTQNQVSTIKDTIINRNEDWRKEIVRKLRKIGFKQGKYDEVVKESYKLLEERAGCKLKTRLENLRQRMALEGATRTAINNANYLDVVGADKRLKEIYISIVNQMYVKYAA